MTKTSNAGNKDKKKMRLSKRTVKDLATDKPIKGGAAPAPWSRPVSCENC